MISQTQPPAVAKPTSANWEISLDCECPSCLEYVNLLDASDFWEFHRGLKVGEHGTAYTNNMKTDCPNCGEEINVCLEY